MEDSQLSLKRDYSGGVAMSFFERLIAPLIHENEMLNFRIFSNSIGIRTLSIVLPARIRDEPSDAPSGLFQTLWDSPSIKMQ